MQNLFKARSKKSTIENKMGKIIVQIIIIQVSLCFICSIIYLIWFELKKEKLPYLEIGFKNNLD